MAIKYFSLSELSDFEACPFYYYKKHIEARRKLKVSDDEYADINSPEVMNLGSYRHKVFEIYMNTKRNLFDIAKEQTIKFGVSIDDFLASKDKFDNFLNRYYINFKVIATEKKYKCIFSNGVALRATVDLLLEEYEDILLINDYKTGDMILTMNDLIYSPQLKLYFLVIKKLFPNYSKYNVQLDSIGQPDPFHLEATEEWASDALDAIEPIYDAVVNAKKKDFIPKAGKRCSICEFYGVCQLMQDLTKIKANNIERISTRNIGNVVKKYQEMDGARKIIEKKHESCKLAIKAYMESIDKNYVEGKWGSASIKSNRLYIKYKN